MPIPVWYVPGPQNAHVQAPEIFKDFIRNLLDWQQLVQFTTNSPSKSNKLTMFVAYINENMSK